MKDEKSKALQKLAIYISISIILLFFGTHPRITEEQNVEQLRSANAYEIFRQNLFPGLPELISPVVVSDLGLLDALNNILFTFVSILWSVMFIPIFFVGGIGVAVTGIVGNSWEKVFVGCIYAFLWPLGILLFPITNFFMLIHQDGGTVAYYVTMFALVAPIFGIGVIASFIGGYQPVMVIVLRR